MRSACPGLLFFFFVLQRSGSCGRVEIERQNLKQEHREVCYLYVETCFLIFEVQQSLNKHL